MKYFTKTLYILIITLTLAVSSFAQTDWLGEYQFGEDGGETAGGSKIYIAHTLKISGDTANTYKIKLYSQGFQTSIDILGTARKEDNKLHIYFGSKGTDHHLGDYKEGGLLLTLESKDVDGEQKLLTFWNEFKPTLDANLDSGKVYFTKINKTNHSEKEANWMRIESEDKKFSVAFPANSIINTEKRKGSVDYSVDGYLNGVSMHLSVYNKKYSTKKLKSMRLTNPRRATDFKVDDFVIRKIDGEGFENFSQTYIITNKKKYYRLYVVGDSAEQDAVKSFLMSIKLNGNPMFKSQNNDLNITKTQSIKQLRTSPEVIEALKRKSQKGKRKIDYELGFGELKSTPDDKNYSRKAIIVEQKPPKFPGPARNLNGSFEIALRIQLLANGQVGDITVLRAPNAAFARGCCVDSARKLKFVPAQINGKNVDSYKLIRYRFDVTTEYRVL